MDLAFKCGTIFFRNNKENVSENNADLFVVVRLTAVIPPKKFNANPTICYTRHVTVLNIQHNLKFNYNTKL